MRNQSQYGQQKADTFPSNKKANCDTQAHLQDLRFTICGGEDTFSQGTPREKVSGRSKNRAKTARSAGEVTSVADLGEECFH